MKMLAAGLLLVAACATPVADEEEGETTSHLSADVHVETQINPNQDRAILKRVVAMIDDTPDTGTIFAAIHSLDDADVANALIAKQRAGATVKVVMNGSAKGKDLPEKLHTELTRAGRKGGFEFCGQPNGGNGCISNAKDGIMHTKLFLFSKTKDEKGDARSDVTWFGSANMTQQTGASTFNNAVAIYGDASLHDQLASKYFADLWARRGPPSANDYYDTSSNRGYYVSNDSGTVVHASPSATDLVAARLDNIEPGPGCKVVISQNMIHFDTRPEILTQLKRIAPKCDVKVLANHINQESLDALAKLGIERKYSKTHDKLFLVDAKFNGKQQQVVFTGSHNWTNDANYSNDELLVKVTDPSAYGTIAGHLINQWTKGAELKAGM